MTVTLRIALALIGFCFIGCHGIGTQRFTAFPPQQAAELENSSHIVIDTTCHVETMRADYNLRENLSMLAPRPKHWKADLTLKVDRVVKGSINKDLLQIHWLHEPTDEQCAVLGISQQPRSGFRGITNGTSWRIGFDDYSGGHF